MPAPSLLLEKCDGPDEASSSFTSFSSSPLLHRESDLKHGSSDGTWLKAFYEPLTALGTASQIINGISSAYFCFTLYYVSLHTTLLNKLGFLR